MECRGVVHSTPDGALIGIGLAEPKIAYHLQSAATQTFPDDGLSFVDLPSTDTNPRVRSAVAKEGSLLFAGSAYVDGDWLAREWIVSPGLPSADTGTLPSPDGSGNGIGPKTDVRDVALSHRGGHFTLVQHDAFSSPAGTSGRFFQIVSPYGWNYVFRLGEGASDNDARALLVFEPADGQGEALLVGGAAGGSPAITTISAETGDQLAIKPVLQEEGSVNFLGKMSDGFLLAGEVKRGDERNALLIRLDGNLEALWVRECGGSGDDVAASARIMGRYILVGGGTRSHLRSQESPSPGAVLTPWLILMDYDGRVQAEQAIEDMSERGPIVGIAPWGDQSAIVVSQAGSIANLSIAAPGPMEQLPNWNGPNTWTHDKLSDGIAPGYGGGIDASPLLPRFALTCVDPLATGPNAALALQGEAAANIATAIRDARYPEKQQSP